MNMPDRAIYNHKPLKKPTSIRLLKLFPGAYNDDLRCQIVHVELDRNPKYEAISYVCGDDLVDSISCKGKRLVVPRNLIDGLRAFRDECRTRVLWADSICINQDDVLEKNHQVPLMGRLFKTATCVLIWFGNDEEVKTLNFVKNSLKIVEDFHIFARTSIGAEHIREVKDEHNPISEWVFANAAIADGTGLEIALEIHCDPASITAMEQFFENPWFSRAWTFQESHLAQKRRFYDGEVEIPERCFAAPACADTLSLCGVSTYPPKKVSASRHIHLICGPNCADETCLRGSYSSVDIGHFWDLLCLRAGSRCKVPSDLVYSLLSSSIDQVDITPDYRLSLAEVFSQAVVQIIKIESCLAVHASVSNHRGSSSHELPSWVPDWREKEQNTCLVDMRYGLFACSGDSRCVYSVSESRLELSVRGFLLDAVVEVEENVTTLKRLIQMAQCGTADRHSSLADERAYRQTMVRRMFCDRNMMCFSDEKRGRSNDLCSSSLGELEKWCDAVEADAAMCSNLLRVAPECAMMACFTTTKKCVGMASKQRLRAGDLVVVLFGCSAPVILRRATGTKEYQFQNVCYVDGWMDGEALELINPADIPYRNQTHKVPSVVSSSHNKDFLPIRDFVLV